MKALTALALTLALAGSAEAAIVYDNTTTYSGMHNDLLPAGEPHSGQRGNTVTLAGTDRAVTEFVVYLGVFCCGVAQFDAQVRFYANDAPGDLPGTLLWASDPTPGIVDGGNPDAVPLAFSFAVPSVVVPDSFTWTIQLLNRQGNMAVMGPSEFDPPTVGSAPFGYWQELDVPPNWAFTGLDEPPFGARITAVGGGAVPATSTVTLAMLAACLLVLGPAVICRSRRAARGAWATDGPCAA